MVSGLSLLAGFAEATLFFVAPDATISFFSLEGRRPALRAAAFALIGALMGGATLYSYARGNPESALALLDWVPAVSPELIEKVGARVESGGAASLLRGGLSLEAFKLYAAQMGIQGTSLPGFLFFGFLIRAGRFLLVGLVFASVGRRLAAVYSLRQMRIGWLVIWAIAYLIYFWMMPN